MASVLRPGNKAVQLAVAREAQEDLEDPVAQVVVDGAAQAVDVSWLFNLSGVSS
jgi:hypothetical protein